jgi:hypothetical protein
MRSAKQNLAAEIAALKEQLASVVATLAALVNASALGERGSYSIKEFLARHRLSESQYHALRHQGRAPRTMRTGSVGVRISRDAERDWILERERDAAEVGANAHGMALREIPQPENEPGAPSRECSLDHPIIKRGALLKTFGLERATASTSIPDRKRPEGAANQTGPVPRI